MLHPAKQPPALGSSATTFRCPPGPFSRPDHPQPTCLTRRAPQGPAAEPQLPTRRRRALLYAGDTLPRAFGSDRYAPLGSCRSQRRHVHLPQRLHPRMGAAGAVAGLPRFRGVASTRVPGHCRAPRASSVCLLAYPQGLATVAPPLPCTCRPCASWAASSVHHPLLLQAQATMTVPLPPAAAAEDAARRELKKQKKAAAKALAAAAAGAAEGGDAAASPKPKKSKKRSGKEGAELNGGCARRGACLRVCLALLMCARMHALPGAYLAIPAACCNMSRQRPLTRAAPVLPLLQGPQQPRPRRPPRKARASQKRKKTKRSGGRQRQRPSSSSRSSLRRRPKRTRPAKRRRPPPRRCWQRWGTASWRHPGRPW